MEDPATPIPNEVIVEILTWLPVKPLLKFRCVCKSWRTLISSHHFVGAHLQKSKSDRNFTTHHRLLRESGGNFMQCSVKSMLHEPVSETFDLCNPIPSIQFRVAGSCNGLVCLNRAKDLILWNPSTRVWRELPVVQESRARSFYYGFGFDESSGDYKVVGFFDNGLNKFDVTVQVYSLRNDEWRRINSFANANWEMFDCATFANGKLYWVASEYNERGERSWDIVSFDLETEEHAILQLPSCVEKGAASAVLGESGGSLFMWCGQGTRGDVWIMDGRWVGNESWTKVVTIPYINDRLKFFYMKALYVKNGRVMLFSFSRSTISIFDARDGSISYPEFRTEFGHQQGFEDYNFATYLESLVSPWDYGDTE